MGNGKRETEGNSPTNDQGQRGSETDDETSRIQTFERAEIIKMSQCSMFITLKNYGDFRMGELFEIA
jgi:hypothetical protein